MEWSPMSDNEILDLADYRRRVYAHYAAARSAADPRRAWEAWRRSRDELFVDHPQSPLELEARVDEYATPFASYEAAFRIVAPVINADGPDLLMAHSSGGDTLFTPFGKVEVSLPTGELELTLYWLQGYGGGIFLPFRDATAGSETYGGGRYLLDTVKGADLGAEDGRLVLDFTHTTRRVCTARGGLAHWRHRRIGWQSRFPSASRCIPDGAYPQASSTGSIPSSSAASAGGSVVAIWACSRISSTSGML